MTTRCPNCGAESQPWFISKDYNRHITNEIFHHYHCLECGLIFISPVPKNLGSYYPDTYHFIPESVDSLERASEPDRYKIEIVQRFVRAGNLLEIGPSYGGFSYLAKKAGFCVSAIEMNAECCKFLRNVVDVHSINSDDAVQTLREAGPYDVIALWHVIEHLPNAWETLEAVCARVKPGGYVVLASPNPEAFQFRVLGRYWLHVDAPRHVMLIPMKLLVAKMEQLGMKVEWITTGDEGSVRCNVGGWELSFINLSSYRYIKQILHRIGRLAAWLFAPLERREGKGSAYTMVFKRVD